MFDRIYHMLPEKFRVALDASAISVSVAACAETYSAIVGAISATVGLVWLCMRFYYWRKDRK